MKLPGLLVLPACCFGAASALLPTEQARLPVTTRSFLTGTTATVDRSLDPGAALALSKQVGRVTMLWTVPNGVGLYQALTKDNPAGGGTTYDAIVRMGFIPVINLNPWTVKPAKGIVRNDGSGEQRFDEPAFVQMLCREAAQVAERFRPRYFSIGNEINSVYEQLGPEHFRGLVALQKELYRSIKKASPETRVLVVLSYSQLVDLGGRPRFRLVRDLAGSYDVLGLTTYPWRSFERPADLPEDYYRRLTRHTRAPIAFTEIGWSSDPSQGGSEEKQAEFLVHFLQRVRGMKVEFINWAFLHDLPESAVTGFVVQRTHLGLGLRRYDGTPKRVWNLFRALADLPAQPK